MLRRALIALTLVGAAAAALLVGTLAAFTSRADNLASRVTAAPDLSAPTVSAAVVGKTQGGVAGFVKRSGTYRVYATVADSGNPASGIATVTANVTDVTAGSTAVPLSAGAFTVDGQSYNYASAQLTAGGALAAGSIAYSLTATDSASNVRAASGLTVTADPTAPTATDVQTANVGGGTAGRPELGDTITLTFSEPIDPTSVLAGWTGAATDVVVRIADGGVAADTLTVFNAANASQLPLGSVALGAIGYVTASTTFGVVGTATPSRMTLSGDSITITLGTATGAASTAAGSGTLKWTPSTTAYDRAANAMAATARNETGTADRDF